MKVHLIDGTFELFRCFHGAPRRKTSNGAEVGAVRGLFATLVSLIRKEGATHIAVAFDKMASRAAKDANDASALLRRQYMPAADLVRALGITIWPMVRYQADDALATGAALMASDQRVEQVIICTTDKDVSQCVRGERVVVRDRIRKITSDEKAVRAKWGVPPKSLPDLLALVGDTADGLPGVPGWGVKASATVLDHYGTLEQIPADPSDWSVSVRGSTRLSENLEAQRREAELVRDLIILRDDLPIRDTVDDLEWRGPRPRLEGMATAMGGVQTWLKLQEWLAANRP